MIAFGAFSLDEEAGRLWRGDVERPLRAKSFAVLLELVRKRGRLVTKEQLFRSCWPDTAVSQTVLRVCIREIRAALGEDALQPTLLETVGRRGYRMAARADVDETRPYSLVGRDRELARLRSALARADGGLRQVVFVTGEPGLGKTALLDHFVEETRARTRARIAFGQCVELLGGTEAYLPVLDLFGRLYADNDAREILAVLERWAPSWLLQMPGLLLDERKIEALRHRVPSPNRDRMLRELGETIEALAADRPLVLVIEDLHWSDMASVDALAYVAQRTLAARLLIIGSYRPSDLALRDHPLKRVKQALQARGRCTELSLESLTRDDTQAYLSRRLTGHPIDPALGRDLHARTAGSPLFMTATVDCLLDRGILAAPEGRWRVAMPLEGIIPDGIRQLAQQQLDRLAPLERRVLDAASTVGVDFAVATVAAATDLSHEEVEGVCATLAARNQLVSATGVAVWPDRTVSGSYEFLHSIYREVLDHLLSPARRRRLHRAVGARIEVGFAGRTAEVAARLAFHFELAGEDDRAVRYHREAAAGAKARFGDREVIVHLQAALAALPRLPETVERSQIELECLLDLGGAFFAALGCASADAVAVHRRALEVADRLELPQARIQAHSALYTFYIMRGDLTQAHAIAEDLQSTAARLPIPFFQLLGYLTLGGALFNLGDFSGARRNLDLAHAAWQPGFPALPLDPTVLYRTMLGFSALIQGQPITGADWIHSSLQYAEGSGSPYNLSYARELAAQFYATAGERELALQHADSVVALATEHDFPIHAAVASIVRGWAVRDSGEIRTGLAAYEARGQLLATSLFRALAAELLLDEGDQEGALRELTETIAFVERSGETRHLAELHRLRGVALLGRGGPSARRDLPKPDELEAETCFRQALAVARGQGARLWELRATVALVDLWVARGRKREARDLLDRVCGGSAGEENGPDLSRAREMRSQL